MYCLRKRICDYSSAGVPFHSKYLWVGVMPFRACGCNNNNDLMALFTSSFRFVEKIKAESLNLDMLIGKYILNLIVEPFTVSQEYV